MYNQYSRRFHVVLDGVRTTYTLPAYLVAMLEMRGIEVVRFVADLVGDGPVSCYWAKAFGAAPTFAGRVQCAVVLYLADQ